MNYRFRLTPNAEKFLYFLPKDISLRIIKKLKESCNNSFHYLKHFEGEDLYKLRIGKYRALVEIDNTNKSLKIIVLDKRGRIYKK